MRCPPARSLPSAGTEGPALIGGHATGRRRTASSRPRGALGLYHLAWQVDTIEELEEARSTLASLDALTGESSHGATKSVYAQDPDGNEFEVMWMLPRADWGRFADAAPVERLDLTAEVRRWAGVRSAAELVPLDA